MTLWRHFGKCSRERGAGSVVLALGASGVQAIDDSVATTLLRCGIVLLRGNVVGAISKRSKHVDGCMR